MTDTQVTVIVLLGSGVEKPSLQKARQRPYSSLGTVRIGFILGS